MVKREARSALCLLVAAALLPACNQVVGISEFDEGYPPEDAGADASGDTDDAGVAADAAGDIPADIDGGTTDAGTTPDAAPMLEADAAVAPLQDAATVPVDGAVVVDAVVPDDGAAACVSLTVHVDSSASGAFMGVEQKDTYPFSVAIGTSHQLCVAAGTAFDLRAFPEQGGAKHTWTGAPCASPERRCSFTLSEETVIHVQLQ
ncbi:MAG: hypothetical protein RL385_318 [Pseudomonadota bacterium]|jgi:hypothetical protein